MLGLEAGQQATCRCLQLRLGRGAAEWAPLWVLGPQRAPAGYRGSGCCCCCAWGEGCSVPLPLPCEPVTGSAASLACMGRLPPRTLSSWAARQWLLLLLLLLRLRQGLCSGAPCPLRASHELSCLQTGSPCATLEQLRQ